MNRYKKMCNILSVIFATVAIIIFLSACSNNAEDTNLNTTYKNDMTKTTDWKTSGFVLPNEISKEQTLWVEDFDEVLVEGTNSQDISLMYKGTIGISEGYLFRYYQTYSDTEMGADISQSNFVLEKYDIETRESEFETFTRQQMGILEGKSRVLIDKMNMNIDNKYVFQIMYYEPNETGIYDRRMQMSYFDGAITEVTDFTEIYAEEGIMKDTMDVISIDSVDCVIDSQWNTYVRGNEEKQLFVFAKDGSHVMKWEGNGGDRICEPLLTDTGEVIFPIYSSSDKCYRLIWINVEKKEVIQLAALENISMFKGYGLWENELYYSTSDSLVMWNICTGEQKSIPLKKYGIDRYSVQNTSLTVLKNGKAVLYGYEKNGDEQDCWLMYLTKYPIEEADTVEIASLLSRVPERVTASVYQAMRKNRTMPFSYIEPGKQLEDYRNIVNAELAAGKGPDVLYVSREDMERMQKQGLLLDLRELLSEELLEQVLPGALALGSVDEMLVGIPPEIQVEAMMISSDVWPEEKWTLEQIILLMENGKLDTRLVSTNSYFSPYATVMLLLRYAYADSFLIDWNKYESHFEDELFIRLLKCVGQGKQSVLLESEQDWQSGKSILPVGAYTNSDYTNFSYQYYVKNGNYVGYPAEYNSGRYIDCSGVLVVNKNTSNPEGVKAYFEALLSKKIQSGTTSKPVKTGGLQVIKIDKNDISAPDNEGRQYWNGMEIGNDESGTTTVEWLEDFVESCVPAPSFHSDIDKIVREEIESYFAGDKSAEEVADIIDNRVQLYLDEQG